MTARLTCVLMLAWVHGAAGAARTFTVDSSASSVTIHVGKTGVGSFAGHEHEVAAPALRGEVVADFDDLPRSSLDIEANARAMKVTGDEPAQDARKVQQTMSGPKVLDAGRFPIIRFRSQTITGRRVAPDRYDLTIAGELSLRGAAKPMTVPVQVEVRGDALTGTGKMVVKQTDFGIEPVSAGGGLVKVEDGVTVSFRIVARPR
ncbi:MAG: YceI family protein [Myxococcales bacterium]